MAETILLVEDEPIIRMDLADHLTAAGYEVSEAASADRAIDLISQGTIFDLIVTDVQLPGKHDGVALALWVRVNHPYIKIIVVSGATARAPELIQLGSEGVIISKPYSLEMVTLRARWLLRGNQTAS